MLLRFKGVEDPKANAHVEGIGVWKAGDVHDVVAELASHLLRSPAFEVAEQPMDKEPKKPKSKKGKTKTVKPPKVPEAAAPAEESPITVPDESAKTEGKE